MSLSGCPGTLVPSRRGSQEGSSFADPFSTSHGDVLLKMSNHPGGRIVSLRTTQLGFSYGLCILPCHT